jgi:uncharacterized membrane protein YgaE (UPF0421/DUF939 family)
MITLNTRTKEAIKTGIAMAIAYGVALQMDWDRPYWAAFAVAFISLPSAGQSLHKGALRIFGTLVAGVAARSHFERGALAVTKTQLDRPGRRQHRI